MEFAAGGFRGTPLRAIAARAGVDVSLLAHYFGSKDALFAATMQLPQRATELLAVALRGDPAGAGERLARGYLSLWEDPGTGPQMQVLARSALSNEAAGAVLRRLMSGAASDPVVAPMLQGRGEDLALAMSGLLGVAFNRYLVGHPALVALDFDDLVARVAPSVQLFLARGDSGGNSRA